MPASHARPLSSRHVLGMAGGLLFAAASAWAGLVIYPEYPDAIERDWAYEVHVTQGSETRSLPVYNHTEKSALTDRTRGGDVNRRFCEFAFSGQQVRVDIRVCEDVQSYKVFPARLGLQTSFADGVISVWLNSPHSFGIELNDYVKTILSVIVDEPENPANVPSRYNPNVLFIDGWMDPPGPDGVLTISNQYSEVYIAPGAVLNSRLYIKKKNVHVHGRGMILDPFSDIFRYDQLNNTSSGVLKVLDTGAVVEDVKLVDARTYNYMTYYNNTTFRNIKAFSSMMCSDGMTCGGSNFIFEGGWFYVGDNALVVGGLKNRGSFSDITIGTSCKAIFPQDNNTDVYMENIDVFRCDEALIANVYNPGTAERNESFHFKNLSAVDSTLFARFFLGGNMGTYVKTFTFENLAIPNSTGTDNWRYIGKSGGKTIRIYDDAGKPWTTGNYELTITNLWVNGARSNGFAESEYINPTGVTVTIVNTAATPPIPAVPNRHVVNWTCPWKRYIGGSLQRDVRFATPKAGEQRLVETNMCANLLEDRPATRSAWQRNPSYKARLDATIVEDGVRIYRVRNCEANSGMYNDITDAFLRRGNGTYRFSFDARVVDGPEIPLEVPLLSNDERVTMRFTVPDDGEWHSYEAFVMTGFDPEITEMVGIAMKSTVAVTEIDFRNLSLTKVDEDTVSFGSPDCQFAHALEITFPGCASINETLTDFPALVRLSTAIPGFRYSDFSLPQGGDLRFFDADGKPVPHEIDLWNEGGESLVWVKVPRLDAGTVMTARYGCIGEPPGVAAKNVWDDGYVGVWHLGESELPMRESSRTSTDFTSSEGTGIGFAAPGVVGGSVDFGASGNSRRLVAPDHYLLDGFESCTFEAWTYVKNRPTGSEKNAGLLCKRNGYGSKASYHIYDNGYGTIVYLSTNGTAYSSCTAISSVSANVWTHQAFSFDKGLLNSYKNGVSASSTTLAAKHIFAGAADLSLGSFNAGDARNFPGKVDEVRISRVARSAAWLKATHDTVMNSNFAAYAPKVAAIESAGYDWTNRVVSVTGATAGETLTLELSTLDGTPLGTVTAVADAEGAATFDVATVPGAVYAYAVLRGGETLDFGTFLAGRWDAEGAWFLAMPDGQGGSIELNGFWQLPPGKTNETSYVVEEPAAFVLSDDAFAAGREKLVRVETGMSYTEFVEEDSEDLDNPDLSDTIAVISPATNSVSGAVEWIAYIGNEWRPLSGNKPPVIETPLVIRFEADFSLASPRVRFSISDNGGASFETLSDAATGAEWIPTTDATKRALSEICTDGFGYVGGIKGTLSNADVASADGVGYASLGEAMASGSEVSLLTNAAWPTNAPAGQVIVDRGEYSLLLPPDGVSVDGNTVVISAGLCFLGSTGTIRVTFADLAAIGIETDGRTPTQIAADLLAVGANGLPKWQSYVLGLDVTDATALPYADIALGDTDDEVSLSLRGVSVNESAGATVSYQVYEAKDLSDPEQDVAVGNPAASGEPVAVEMDGSGAQFFRLKVIIEAN